MQECSIEMHITYDAPLEVKAFAKLLNTIDKSFGYAYGVLKEKYRDIDFPTKSPVKLKDVKEGSIWLDLLTNICVDIAVGVLVSVLVDYLKDKINIGRKKPEVYSEDGIIIVNILQASARASWTEVEEELFVRKAVETYVVKGLHTDPKDFIGDSGFEDIVDRHGPNALRRKLENIKAIFDDLCVSNTLDIKGSGNYSKRNRDLVAACLFYSNVSYGGSK